MKKVFKVEGLDCANCAAKMEEKINKLDGVKSASVSFVMQKITIETVDDNMDEIMKQVVKICRKIEPDFELC